MLDLTKSFIMSTSSIFKRQTDSRNRIKRWKNFSELRVFAILVVVLVLFLKSTEASGNNFGKPSTTTVPPNPKVSGSHQAKSYYHPQAGGGYYPPSHGDGHGLWDKSGFGSIEHFLPILALIGFGVLVLPVLGALFATFAGSAFGVGNPITTATVAGKRRRRDASQEQDDLLVYLLKAMETLYGVNKQNNK